MRLTVKGVSGMLQVPGKYSDGDGLYLRVTKPGSGCWFYRYQSNGKQHWKGSARLPTRRCMKRGKRLLRPAKCSARAAIR